MQIKKETFFRICTDANMSANCIKVFIFYVSVK